MFESKNRTLLLIALAAILSSANSFGAQGGDGASGWNWRSYMPNANSFYSRIPSWSALGHAGGSALAGASSLAPLLAYKNYSNANGDDLYLASAALAASVAVPQLAQSILEVTLDDEEYPINTNQQRWYQAMRALAGAGAAAALSYSSNRSLIRDMPLIALAGVLAGGAPSSYEGKKERLARLTQEKTQLKEQLKANLQDETLLEQLRKNRQEELFINRGFRSQNQYVKDLAERLNETLLEAERNSILDEMNKATNGFYYQQDGE